MGARTANVADARHAADAPHRLRPGPFLSEACACHQANLSIRLHCYASRPCMRKANSAFCFRLRGDATRRAPLGLLAGPVLLGTFSETRRSLPGAHGAISAIRRMAPNL